MADKDVSFMRSLAMGDIREDVITPFPAMRDADKETLSGVIASIDDLLGRHRADYPKWDVAGEFPAEFIEELRQFGMFSLVIPEQHGGLGFGSAAYSRALQQIARYDASVAVTVGAHSSIGMRGLLLFGTEEQRERYYSKLATGELIAAFCLTEPGAGSDAASIRTRAEPDGDDWILNGEKLWITNGGIADFFTVFARTGEHHITAFLVTRDMGGVSNGPHEDKMGLRASSTTTVSFENVRVPGKNVLGEVHKGFKVAMNILNSGRSGLGGGSIGAMKHLIELATRHANERHQFGQPIRSYGLVKHKVGQMIIDCYASESVVNMVAGLSDQGYEDYAVEAAISKVFASEALFVTADQALQIAGGVGYMRELPYERIMRDCRINRIFEGTNEVLRLFIALTAMRDAASELKELATSAQQIFNDPIKGFGVLRDYALRRASLATGVTRERGRFGGLDPALAAPVKVFEEQTRSLATAVDRILRKHGKNIIGKQFASRRLANIMIDLFVLACTISRVDAAVRARGAEASAQELELVGVLAGQVRGRVERNARLVDDNDDEHIKAIADHAFEREGYGWDVL
ncbi:MAG: acyl-CoA dehydrogenase family protein [Sorangiineae bacterium]|nr:acyl-CoA dehydrogenase family protein [Polyangiaceae bacterium]MEB2321949.1 acyl-CoA dehydrogenase family protein [Sorangiineae bacterium]